MWEVRLWLACIRVAAATCFRSALVLCLTGPNGTRPVFAHRRAAVPVPLASKFTLRLMPVLLLLAFGAAFLLPEKIRTLPDPLLPISRHEFGTLIHCLPTLAMSLQSS